MPRQDFLRLFKQNEEAWTTMFTDLKARERQMFARC